MGDLIPVRGRHYWEVEVDEHLDYTVGVAFEDVPKQEELGANCLSWCMRHTWAKPRWLQQAFIVRAQIINSSLKSSRMSTYL
uniref:Fibronectin type III and SPRY domain containing 2 n=1 Tax=Molossus molossus TaxID=27622 RepID=A0A7J8BKF2_MOLMO|nr:fibronectin type III and SPRY domain containing 2 [Molossus molossus]